MSVFDFIREGKYESKVPCSVEIVPVNEDTMTVRQAREHKEAEKERDRRQRRLHDEERARLNAMVKADLEEEYGVIGHPKADKLWEIAWEHGHSSGYHDVACHYAELVELIQP